jgi:hypothetical protein
MRSMMLIAATLIASAATVQADDGLTKGTPDLKSASALAFGPNGLLFIGDPQSAAIFAVDTGDAKTAGDKPVNVERVDAKVAGLLGTTEKDVKINDLKVNPASGNIYLAVTRGTGAGTPAIVRITRADAVEAVSLKDVPFAKVTIPNPAMGKGATTAITNMAFLGDKLYVAGLSSEAVRLDPSGHPVPFPKETDKGTAIEIYHGAHGAVETRSPIRTFAPYKVNGEDTLMAAYTCTPLVKVPVSELKPG